MNDYQNNNYEKDELTGKVIGLAIEVHKNLGPGLLESAYQQCLLYELEKVGYMSKMKKYCPLNIKKLLSKKLTE